MKFSFDLDPTPYQEELVEMAADFQDIAFDIISPSAELVCDVASLFVLKESCVVEVMTQFGEVMSEIGFA